MGLLPLLLLLLLDEDDEEDSQRCRFIDLVVVVDVYCFWVGCYHRRLRMCQLFFSERLVKYWWRNGYRKLNKNGISPLSVDDGWAMPSLKNVVVDNVEKFSDNVEKFSIVKRKSRENGLWSNGYWAMRAIDIFLWRNFAHIFDKIVFYQTFD